MPEIEYHPEAETEVFEAFQWYGKIDQEVCQRFKVELDRAESLILRSPNSWAPYFHSTRGFRFNGFPFVLAYIQRNERIIAVALAHTRRRPGYWSRRLSS
jgi:hypothetical protein